MLKFREI